MIHMTKEADMKKLLSLILALGVGAVLSGCGNTLSGAKQDAATNAQKTQQAAADATQSTKDAAHRAGQAVEAVPQNAEANAVRVPVKTAIVRDPVLADSRNLISVNGQDHTITLLGHVADASMKQRASEDAQVALKKHPGYTLDNQLTVSGAAQ